MTDRRSEKPSDAEVIGLVAGAHFFSHFYLLVLPPLFPILKSEFGLSYAALGGVLTAFSVASGVAQYPMGILVDRLGARWILIGGLTLLASSVALLSLADGYWMLIGLFFLAGLGNSVFHPADYSILGASVRESRLGRAYSIHTFSGHVGWSVAPPIVIFLTALWNWRAALAIVGLAGLLMVLVLVLRSGALRSDLHHHHGQPAGAAARGGVSLRLSAPILMMFMFYTVTAGVTVGMSSITPSALYALFETPLVSANMVLTAVLVGGAVGVLTGGFVADKVGRLDLVAAVGFVGAALAMCLVPTVTLPLWGLVVVFGFSGFMVGVVAPSRDLMVRAVTPPGASGKVFAFVSVGLDVGGATAPPIFGWLIDQGAPSAVFFGTAALLMIALFAATGAAQYGRRAAASAAAE